MPREPGGQLVEREFLTLPVWDHLDTQTAETVARAVERCLPEPWAFARVARHECGDQKRHVAFFDWKGSEFALIPGGEVTLGYDPANPFVPTAEQRASFDSEDWMQERGDGLTFEVFLADVLTPLRRASFGPVLAEGRANPLPPESVQQDERGNKTVWPRIVSIRQVIEEIHADGFRWPTFDEWEYLCGAGSRTLWRWGDDHPPVYPDSLTDERDPEYDRSKLPSERPNSFGLRFANQPYKTEWCCEPFGIRGGDGGSFLHGGCGLFCAWLPLATAYGTPYRKAVDQEKRFGGRFRRMFPLPDSMFG
jgi:hypothetical protein